MYGEYTHSNHTLCQRKDSTANGTTPNSYAHVLAYPSWAHTNMLISESIPSPSIIRFENSETTFLQKT